MTKEPHGEEWGLAALDLRMDPEVVEPDADFRHTGSLEIVSEWALVFAGAAVAAVYVLDETADELRLAETVGSSGALHGLRSRTPLSGRSPVADAFRAGRPLWCNSPELAASQERGPEAPPGDVWLGVLPLEADSGRQGCLLVVDDVGGGFDAERRGFLQLYADQIAGRLAAGAGPGAGGAGGEAGRSVPDPALDRLSVGSFTLIPGSGRIEADARMLELLDIAPGDFDGRLETLLARALPDDLTAVTSIADPGPAISGFRELKFRIRRRDGDLCWLHLRCRALVGADGRPERVLGAVADASHLRPTADEVSRVQRLAATLADAMTVRDVSRVVVAALREPLRADRVALAELESDRLVVSLLDPPEPAAWPETWRSGWQPDATAAVLPTLQAALREGHASLWPEGSRLEPGLAGIGPGGLAVLPLPADERIVGACLIGWDERHEFGPEEGALLTAAAGLVGQALVRAHTYDAEHELATMLQRSLLPRTLPTLPGGVAVARYLPATVGLDVGGDWYDVMPLSEGHAALVIGDVQGHSAEAATIMGQIRTAIRAYAFEGHAPDVVVSHANRLLAGMETDLFATCAYVDLDLEEGNAWIVRAGHLPPLLRHPDGSTEEVAVEGGPPLGVLGDAEFPMTAIGLSPGSVLALMTDGMVESVSLSLEAGMRRVRDVLADTDPSDAGCMADALLGGATRRDDDMALLLLRYDGMRVKPIRVGWTVWRLPDAVMHARRFTARTLRSWKMVEEGDVVLLVVSELVTNALIHTQGEVRLDLVLTGDRIRVAVSDSSPRAPAKPVSVDWESTGGRGILLVEAMTESWGSVPVSGGKQVWGEVALPPDARLATEAGPEG